MRRLSAALALGLIFPGGARPAVLERVEVVEDGGPVVRLHVSEPVKPVAHALAAGPNLPDRIYLDLPVTSTGPAASAVIRGVGPLMRVRTGRFDAGTVRVVLDLAAALPFTVETDARTVTVRLGPRPAKTEPPATPASQPAAAPAAEPAGPPSTAPSAPPSTSPSAVAPAPPTEPRDVGMEAPVPRAEPPVLRAETPPRASKPPAAAEAPRTAVEPSGPAEPPPASPAPSRPPERTDRQGSSVKALPVIIIDPGHGGHDPGAAGVGGVIEKDVVLEIARRLAVKLATRLPVSVVLTRLDDSYVPIERRVPEAAEAALFLSLHANACHDPSARGVEVFYGGGDGGGSGDPFAADRAMRLGRAVESALATVVGGVRGDARPGTFAVLARNAVPGVLVEIGYLTHPGDAARACDGAYQDLLTDALVEGVRDFLRVSAPVL